MQKKLLILLVLILSLFFLFGCVQQSDSNSLAQLNNSNVLQDNGINSLYSTQPIACPYACCDSSDYVAKGCSENYECEQNVCVPVCRDVTYFEDIPKQISVPFEDNVCVDVPYQESYQEQECHLENLTYSTTSSLPVLNDYWTIEKGCTTEYYLNIKNTDQQAGSFQAKFDLKLQNNTIQQKTTTNNISSGATVKFSVSYDRSCFEQIPTINTFQIISPQKNVCVMVTKYRSLTRQECHLETKYRTETIYESVQKTKTVCGNETDNCSKMTCDDNQECTIDSCSNSLCQHLPKSDGQTCTGGTCANGFCATNDTTVPSTQNCVQTECSVKSTFSCQGTTKMIVTFSCGNNVCSSSNSQQTNSVSCGYVASAPTQSLSIKDKVQDLFNRFTEFKSLQNGSAVNLYLLDETTDFSITKNSSNVTVVESDTGDITMSLDNHVFKLLYNASDICSKAKELKAQGLISEYNFVQNAPQNELIAKGYNNLINCFS